MRIEFPSGGTFGFAADNLKGFARTLAEVEWLLLVLVLLYLTVAQEGSEERTAILMALFFFGAFVLSFHYTNFFRRESLWKFALESGTMLLFITWVGWYSGRLASPLLNLYLLAIVASALVLGKSVSLGILAVIAGCYVFFGHAEDLASVFTLAAAAKLLAQLAPVLLVGYLTTMLAADIRYVVDRIHYASQTDDLTGQLNMRGFMPLLEREAGRAERYTRRFSLLMMDCDNLKSVNDKYGHEAGNEALRFVVQRAGEVLRGTDVLARYGGDEFLILLPETGSEGACLVAERIRSVVEAGTLRFQGAQIGASVSIGIATYPDNGREIRELIHQADKAMYRSKTSGKNTVSAAA